MREQLCRVREGEPGHAGAVGEELDRLNAYENSNTPTTRTTIN